VGVFDPLKHYYAAEVNAACHHLSGLSVNISKPDFIALYDKAKMLKLAAENMVNV